MKGQTSFELLVILAAVFAAILIGVVLSQQGLVGVNTTQIQQKADTTVDALSAAAKEVYSQGEGARKRVFVDIPSTYDASKSLVVNRSVTLRALESDFVATFDFDVTGNLPLNSGPQWVWVVNEGNRVRIGTGLITVNKQSIVVRMQENSTGNDTILITNIYTDGVNVTLTPQWTNGSVSLSISDQNFTFAANTSKTVLLTFLANTNAVGFYTGTLFIEAKSGNLTDSIYLPITVEILSAPSGAPPLSIIPSTWNETMLAGQNVSKAFTVCTNTITAVTDVTFTTAGIAGNWVGNLDPLGPLSYDTCMIKVFTVTVPNGTLPGNNTGVITGQGGGVANARDTVALSITVGGNVTDIIGPVVRNITRNPQRIFVGNIISLGATCDDTNRGNSTIKRGEIRINNGTWSTLVPNDGNYDSIIENISSSITGLLQGTHNISLRCTDVLDNVGPESLYPLTVLKPILFITKDEGGGGAEGDWEDWLNTHPSEVGISWAFDRVHHNDVTQNTVNSYAMVLLAEGVFGGANGANVASYLSTYTLSGGYVVVVDNALEGSYQQLGLGSGTAFVTQTSFAVRNNGHYITSPFGNQTVSIYATATKLNYIASAYTGTTIGTPLITSPLAHAALGSGGGYIVWGASRPYRFNTNGTTVTTRIFDYAITNSTIGTT